MIFGYKRCISAEKNLTVARYKPRPHFRLAEKIGRVGIALSKDPPIGNY